MLNEIKFDHTKPVWATVWDHKTKHKRIYLYTFEKHHYCVSENTEQDFLDGKPYRAVTWLNISFSKEKKYVPLDAKTCPRRPVLTRTDWTEGVEHYPSIYTLGLYSDHILRTWDQLFRDARYLINGQPARREVEE